MSEQTNVQAGALLKSLTNMLSKIFDNMIASIFNGEDGISAGKVEHSIIEAKNGTYGLQITNGFSLLLTDKNGKDVTVADFMIIDELTVPDNTEDIDLYKDKDNIQDVLDARMKVSGAKWDLKVMVTDLNKKVVKNASKEFKNVSANDITKYNKELTDSLKGYFDEILNKFKTENADMFAEENANSSKHMKLTLQKVISATSVDINLTSITANYNLNEVQADMDAVLDDDDFISLIPTDNEATFDISVSDDGFDVCECEESDTEDTNNLLLLQELFADSVQYLSRITQFYWGARGRDVKLVSDTAHAATYSLENLVSVCAKAIYDASCKLPTYEVQSLGEVDSIHSEDLVTELVNTIMDFRSILKFVSDFIDEDIKIVVNETYSDLKSYVSELNRCRLD